MARKQRDYKAEYARRIERARQKAEEKGEVFEKAKARGHGSAQRERQRAASHRANTGRFSERTLERLHGRMLNTDHAMERLVEAQDAGLSLSEIERLIELQNEATELWRIGRDDEARAIAYELAELSDDYGAELDKGWYYYH